MRYSFPIRPSAINEVVKWATENIGAPEEALWDWRLKEWPFLYVFVVKRESDALLLKMGCSDAISAWAPSR